MAPDLWNPGRLHRPGAFWDFHPNLKVFPASVFSEICLAHRSRGMFLSPCGSGHFVSSRKNLGSLHGVSVTLGKNLGGIRQERSECSAETGMEAEGMQIGGQEQEGAGHRSRYL